MRTAFLLAAALLALDTGRAVANTCMTNQPLPAHQELPAGCPVVVYTLQGSPGAVTAVRGADTVVVGTAGTTATTGVAPVHRTVFDVHACAWIDRVDDISFALYTIDVTSQPGDVLSLGDSQFTVRVGAAGACPAAAMSWLPQCADPLPAPDCVPDDRDGGHPCDGGVYDPDGGELTGIDERGGGGCSTGGGGAGALAGIAGALGLLVARRRRRPVSAPGLDA